MKLISFDPGGTTGVAIVQYSDTEPPRLDSAFQIENGLEGFVYWARQIDWSEFDAIVCESFILRPSVKFPDLSPVYIIGAMEALISTEIAYQPPSSKPLCPDDLLKRIEFYTRGRPHANDATRHAIIYLRNKRNMPALRFCWPED